MADALWQSVYQTLHSFITFLPNLVGAIVILVLGWFVSLLLAKLIERGLRAVGMERVGDYAGLNQFLQQSGSKWTTSHAIATLLKWLIFLIFIQAAATLLGVPQITQVINTLILYIPRIVLALVVMVIGAWVSKVLAGWVQVGLEKIGLEEAGKRAGINEFFHRAELEWTTVQAVATVVRWFILLIFLQAATSILGIPQLTQIINDILFYLPNIAVAMVVLIVGFWVGKVLGGVVRASLANFREVNPELVAQITRYSIVGLAVVIALSQLKVAPIIVNTLFIGLVAILVLAFGLSFGLGGREVAARIVTAWYEKSPAVMQSSAEGGENKPIVVPEPPTDSDDKPSEEGPH
jgi:hypothetical protein